MNNHKIRVRFAPSPTGPLHIGGVRTALFNYLFAKKNKGVFILRIEDTDQTRYVEGSEEYIQEALSWCGIKFDEGIVEGGLHTPYKQSERKDIYKKYADILVASGNAYYAFDSAEELDALRKSYEIEKKAFAYDATTRQSMKNSLSLSESVVNEKILSGIPYVIRFKIPENRDLVMQDIIRGTITVNTSSLDDKVLFKSDGLPTYHLANVVDDYLMEISHVIRGEEWLPSLPLHVLLYEALGFRDAMPEFAHLPLILKPSGKGKLSKRDGDQLGFPVFPTEWKSPDGEIASGYRESGYFPEAFVNMIALLGWNPGTEQELFSMDELIQSFSLDRVNKAGARFDPEKTKWFNHQYLIQKSDEKLAYLFMAELNKHKIETDIDKAKRIVGLTKDRVNFVSEFWDQSKFFFVAPEVYDEAFTKKQWKVDSPDIIKEIRKVFLDINDFTSPSLENAVKLFVEQKQIGFGSVMNPLRSCLVGAGTGPHLFDIAEMLGKDEVVNRIDKALSRL